MGALMTSCGNSTQAPSSDNSSQKGSAAEIASYEGADREQKLVEAAKKEGSLNLYTSMALEDMQKLASEFEKKYDIKVNIWRAGSENVLQRIVTEAKGGRFEFDVVETNGPEMEAVQREKLLQEVKSPYLKDLIPQAVFPHKEWVATRLNVFVQAYNTNKVKKEELPKSYQDLLDPKWKGRLGIEAEDLDYFAAVVKEMGEEKGINYWKDLVSTNGLSVRKGHTLLAQLVASGEVPFALTVYSYKVEQLKTKDKAPVDWFALDPAIARPNGVGVSRKAPHPNAAVLFYDFMISDAQKMLSSMEFVPTNSKIGTGLNDIKLKFVDPAIILDENEKWSKLYDEIIVKKASKK
ncbi:ABC transporter substrate-binding protein [Effusibacillus lacus]|uniref:ABC transporter substrate-binding protein n=2 Tax=Effusibacillus lacus TaxID=1348429 RepID=A0A292YR07_9BACL|nr:ABC transporter substrate-binding protein [Effusibacillus lacus]